MPEKYYLSDKQVLALIAKAKKDKANGNGFGYQIIGKNANTITAHYAKDAHDNLLIEDKKTLKTIRHARQGSSGVFDGLRVRRLMPIECERLQGLPENWTKTGASGNKISDFQRYKCCGNAVSVPVVQHILERMMQNQ